MNWMEIAQTLSFVGGILVGAGLTLAAAVIGIVVFLWGHE